jgi:hypothetical protein
VSDWKNIFHHFERFHIFMNPGTNFYVTPSQAVALAREKLEPGTFKVLVGGSSVLYGSGQPRGQVWTENLQKRLGDEYKVLNLGFCGAGPQEIGSIVAEVLVRDNPHLYFVNSAAVIEPVPIRLDGLNHHYFIWDAYYKGMLARDALRDEAIAAVLADHKAIPSLDELLAQKQLNSWCYFDDLWTALAYTRGATIWSSAIGPDWRKPRRRFADPEEAPRPLAKRYPKEALERNMVTMRQRCDPTGLKKSADGHWIKDPGSPVWNDIVWKLKHYIPESVRRRTLMVIQLDNPHYVKLLNDEERERYWVRSETVEEIFQSAGFRVVRPRDGFTDADFSDLMHLAPEGGVKLAALVARELSKWSRLEAEREEPANP